jgi:hypothetical protein
VEAGLPDFDVSEMLDVRGFRGGDLLEVREDDLLDFSVFLLGSFALSVSAYKSMKSSLIKVPVILLMDRTSCRQGCSCLAEKIMLGMALEKMDGGETE